MHANVGKVLVKRHPMVGKELKLALQSRQALSNDLANDCTGEVASIQRHEQRNSWMLSMLRAIVGCITTRRSHAQ